jgi:esterase/lipase
MSSKKRAGNYEACRDLSGRRIRTVNQARLINEYLQRKPELEAKKEQEIREKMEKAIRAPDRKIIFEDADFLQTTRRVVDEVELAVMEAIYGTDDLDGVDPNGKLPVKH